MRKLLLLALALAGACETTSPAPTTPMMDASTLAPVPVDAPVVDTAVADAPELAPPDPDEAFTAAAARACDVENMVPCPDRQSRANCIRQTIGLVQLYPGCKPEVMLLVGCFAQLSPADFYCDGKLTMNRPGKCVAEIEGYLTCVHSQPPFVRPDAGADADASSDDASD
jgi:hypothetical protein